MNYQTILSFLSDHVLFIVVIFLIVFFMYSLYLKMLLKEEREQNFNLSQKFSDRRIDQFEYFIEIFKTFIIESQGTKIHEISEELDGEIREFLLESTLLNAEKNLEILAQWSALLNSKKPIVTRKAYNLFTLSIKNMRIEIGLKSKTLKTNDLITLLHATEKEVKAAQEEGE